MRTNLIDTNTHTKSVELCMRRYIENYRFKKPVLIVAGICVRMNVHTVYAFVRNFLDNDMRGPQAIVGPDIKV